eukprot:GHRR01008289.1.p1 GENE.GHRR01008289.1~~GHRR01008289.1.p1  ORF type:complete len:138 (+),score=27.50 GHRR01008289.1:810-1223(+)
MHDECVRVAVVLCYCSHGMTEVIMRAPVQAGATAVPLLAVGPGGVCPTCCGVYLLSSCSPTAVKGTWVGVLGRLGCNKQATQQVITVPCMQQQRWLPCWPKSPCVPQQRVSPAFSVHGIACSNKVAFKQCGNCVYLA